MAARSRKGSGGSRASAAPRGTLGTLLRTTLAQAGVVRDVLERGAREGRARLDDARRGRRRDQSLIRLGEAVLEAVRAGDAQDLFDLPDVADALAELDGLDAGAEDAHAADPAGTDDDRRSAPIWVPPGIRERFDRRPPRPPPIAAAGDGTVSSSAWRPPRTAAAPPPIVPPAAPDQTRQPRQEPGARFQEPGGRGQEPPARKGGIQFARDDDDDDLAAYMHPDDVPPKGSKDSDGDA